MSTTRLFVYGTLRRDAGRDIHRLIARHAEFVGRGRVRGRLFMLGDYPAMAVDADSLSVVAGELYELPEGRRELALLELDDYEGIGPNHSRPHDYRREVVAVEMSDGTRIDAWAYVLNRGTEGLPRIESGDFVGERGLGPAP